jgi:hypothetical protein
VSGRAPFKRDGAVAAGRGYSLTGWNCERYASWCITGVAVSQQVTSAVAAFFEMLMVALIATTAALLARATFAE